MTSAAHTLTLGISGFGFADLYDPERLRDLSLAFDQELSQADPDLAREFTRYRSFEVTPPGPEESALLLRVAPHVARFVGRLFQVEEELSRIEAKTRQQDPVFFARRDFFVRRVFKKGAPLTPAEPEEREKIWRQIEALAQVSGDDLELSLSRAIVDLLAAEKQSAPLPEALASVFGSKSPAEILRRLTAWAHAEVLDPRSSIKRGWTLFHIPHTLDYQALVPLRNPRADLPELLEGREETRRFRDGFSLTDPRMSTRQVLGEVDYCIYCHKVEKDSCSAGLREKSGAAKKNPLGIDLEGCPLDERISEAHLARKEGNVLGALALICIDNPMLPGTGHRICNDCMKACVYQKQDPVNIPQIETNILTEVLSLPWGFEIWSLLTRWNPLNRKRPYPRPYTGKNVLVVGLGPAGYTLAHHLVNEGFGVVGIDGLKLEPLPEHLIKEPIRDIHALSVPLDERTLVGFGGVSEYGITVRWDKNFLTMLYLNLLRRERVRLYGGVRFGGTLTIEDAWQLGFSHIAVATGAGKPTLINLKNNLIRGIRKASDFLMALQLTGAFKKGSLANLQLELPVVVIGGGLTAIDTATEAMAYYPVQVERVLTRFEELCREQGEEALWKSFDPEETRILKKFLEHGQKIREEREKAKAEGRAPDFISLIRQWGGVTIAYRKTLTDSPAYRLNHEEVEKSLEEGIFFAENLNPIEAIPDEFGAVNELVFERTKTREKIVLPARSVLVAAGTSPNIIYEKENPGTFALDENRKFFQTFRAERASDGQIRLTPDPEGMFTSYQKDGKLISFYGDNHPKYAGNVVKAMASAKRGYEQLSRLFAEELEEAQKLPKETRDHIWHELCRTLDDGLIARVVRVDRLTPTIVEVIIRAPYAARKFHPGQFYRLQNFESFAPEVDGTRLLMEGIALTGAWVDRERGLLSLIVLEMGGSSRLCALLRPGEQVVVMGPTGAPTEIPKQETVLLVGGGLGNAVLFSIAKSLRQEGSRVIYFAGYRKKEDLYKREEIEASTDLVVWSVDQGELIAPCRPQDRSVQGNVVQAMTAYARGELGTPPIPFHEVSRIIAIGSDRMMAAVARARHEALAPYLRKEHVGIGSINSPMQCMMKEVCAQCLQKHKDPVTGKESVVFSCFNQDQLLDQVDWKNLRDRLRANAVLEKLANAWVDRLLKKGKLGPYAESAAAQG